MGESIQLSGYERVFHVEWAGGVLGVLEPSLDFKFIPQFSLQKDLGGKIKLLSHVAVPNVQDPGHFLCLKGHDIVHDFILRGFVAQYHLNI